MTSWRAPSIERSETQRAAGEREAVESWLDFHRETMLLKCAGLDADQLKTRAVPPSGMSLLGLVRHMVEVERWWFRINVAGEDLDYEYCTDESPDGDWDLLDGADPEADFATWHREVEAARAAVRDRDLDETFKAKGRAGHLMNLRWVYLHMVEEYARHNGHADLLRERIDGATGD